MLEVEVYMGLVSCPETVNVVPECDLGLEFGYGQDRGCLP